MSEGFGFSWGKVIANFIWILGAAVILADIGYHEFLTRETKAKWKDIFRSDSFLRPAHLGLILAAFGIMGSLKNPFLAGVFSITHS